MVLSNRARGSGHKVKFYLNLTKYFFTVTVFEQWKTVSRMVMESLPVEILKTSLDLVLGSSPGQPTLADPDDLQRSLLLP